MTKGSEDSWGGLQGINRLLEHRVRLGICALLSRNDALTFRRFKVLLKETDGSLGAHLRKLEDAEFLTVQKTFQDRKPVSWYRLTQDGRRALEKHFLALEKLIKGEL